MKKKLFLVALSVTVYVVPMYAQYILTQQVSNVTGELRGVYFTSVNHGVVVGSPSGIGLPSTIVRTDDAGITWVPVVTAFTDTLRAVWFIDDTTGFACGANGRILKTTDGGTIWDSVSTGVNNLLRTITFPSATIGYSAGGGGQIIKTTDGGTTWTPLISGVSQDLINMRFANVDTGFVVSSNGTFTNGFILKTTDGGTTWTQVYTDPQGLLGLAVPHADTIYAGGGTQTIVQSFDGGTTWNITNTGVAANNIRTGFFTDGSHGFMAGDLGAIFRTTNAGVTWTNIGTFTNGNLGMNFPSVDTGYFVGNTGSIIRYNPTCLPILNAPLQIFGADSICGKDSLSFYINAIAGATSYQWTAPLGAIVNNQGDTMVGIKFNGLGGTVTAAGINQCGPGAAVVKNIYLYSPTPQAPVSRNFDTLFANIIAVSYQWFNNGVPIMNANGPYYIFTQNGNYTVMITDNHGCTSLSIPWAVNNVGVNDIHDNSGCTVFPQPFHDHIEIINHNKYQVFAELSDVSGRLAWSDVIAANSRKTISTITLQSGVYFMKLGYEDGRQWTKLVVKY